MAKGAGMPGGGPIGSMFIISLAIHLLVLSGSVFWPLSSSPRITFGPVYNVNLVSLPASLLKASGTSTALDREFFSTDSGAPEKALKKQADFSSKAVKKADPVRSSSRQVEQALADIRRRVAVMPSSESSGSSSSAGPSNADPRMARYSQLLWARVRSQWALPRAMLPRDGIEAVIRVRILRTGTLTDIAFETRSGNATFDNSAFRAVTKANPVPPLPDWYRGNSMDVGIRFHSSELR